ncbi:MAG TPA: hypothetical protein VJW51_03735 [Candidatus Acidoferrales bacterium]|nr:hypothetical protein [Candidatus Acidoferrales bacterium]
MLPLPIGNARGHSSNEFVGVTEFGVGAIRLNCFQELLILRHCGRLIRRYELVAEIFSRKHQYVDSRILGISEFVFGVGDTSSRMDGPIGRAKHKNHQISVRKLRETLLKRRLGGRPEILHTNWPISKLQNLISNRLAFGFESFANRGNENVHLSLFRAILQISVAIRWQRLFVVELAARIRSNMQSGQI